jgi:mono/diheme cytochrome c family protein
VGTPLRWSQNFFALALILLAIFIAIGSADKRCTAAAKFAGSSASRSARQLYLKHCARCHGESGKGNGPQAASFHFQLRSFADCDWMEMRSDAVLYLIVKSGSAGIGLLPGMPAFDGKLTADQIASLVQYIRTLCPGKDGTDTMR